MRSGKWVVIEKAEVPKLPHGDGEDRLVLVHQGADLIACAVVDGTTDKNGRRYGAQTGGALAADCVADALAVFAAGLSPAAALDFITHRLAAMREAWSVAADDLLAPSAVAAVFIPDRGEIWRVGDVHIAVRQNDKWKAHTAGNAIDRVVADARAALLHCSLAQGKTADELAASDPGREMVMPILKSQNVLANIDNECPLGFGVLNGRPIPRRYLEVLSLDERVTEVVLASDGYLGPAPTLERAEADLAASLKSDPLRIGEHASSKAVTPGATSFDDRTYVRLRLMR